MPYIINFTDRDNKTPITVFDNTTDNTSTSLDFPGRNVTNYGQIIAENFLKLLENFSRADSPRAPVEGQLWYDSSENILKIFDNVSWKAASGIQKGSSTPNVDESNVGELWVDTTNQQLRLYTGNRWILVGPVESSIDGLRYGPVVETIADSDNQSRSILTLYVADVPVAIVSKDTFTPKVIVEGFSAISAGINITSASLGADVAKLFGTASSADNLVVAGSPIPAGRFLRSDITNTVDANFNIRGGGGLTLGVDSTFNLSTSSTAAKIYNSTSGSSIDLQVNRGGIPVTIVRVLEDRVGINKPVPDQALDIVGNVQLTGSLILTNDAASSSLSTGSVRTAGGAAISKNLRVGTDLTVEGVTQTTVIQPKFTNTYTLGTDQARWSTVFANKIIAAEIQGALSGSINGNAATATSLKDVTTFQLSGDVVSPPIQFDGQVGSYTKIFNTALTSNIIVNKPTPFPIRSDKSDTVLVYRPSLAVPIGAPTFRVISIGPAPTYTCTSDVFHGLSVGDIVTPATDGGGFSAGNPYNVVSVPSLTTFQVSVFADGSVLPLAQGTYSIPMRKGSLSSGLIKETRDVFIADLGVPIGAIMPYAGSGLSLPYGYLLCDGSEYERARYPDLYDVIGNIYGTASIGFETFKLPDLRGRFPLGADNMDNRNDVNNQAGQPFNAGGGPAGRVAAAEASQIGQASGQSSVPLQLTNLPQHQHTLSVDGREYNALRIDTAVNAEAAPGLGPTAPGQAQYVNRSGNVVAPGTTGFQFGTPVGVMNPYQTVNYIIRAGAPRLLD